MGSWSPGIGDPTFIGWFTVLAYLVAFVLCRSAARRPGGAVMRPSSRPPTQPPTSARARAGGGVGKVFLLALIGGRRHVLHLPPGLRRRALWVGLTVLMFCLGVNKQLDLQTALTEGGRILFRSWGLMDVRRPIQVAFIGGVLVASGWMLRGALLLGRGLGRSATLALTGTVFLLGFVAIRASSFHHVDTLLGLSFAGFTLNWALELTGIGLVAGGALLDRIRPQTMPTDAS